MPETLVPDTSVLVDGRITDLIASDHPGARVLVPLAALAELEAQANRGQETGVAGLDELAKLQHMAAEGKCKVEFVGERPTSEEMERAKTGAVDARIRDTAVAVKGLFVTSDRIQAHAAAAQGVRHHYIRPIVRETTGLEHLGLWRFFDAQTMSVHLKADCVPMAKKGRPGQVSYENVAHADMKHVELRAIVRECIEYAKRDYNSFIEMEKPGCTVLQVGPMRITIAQPPFSDGLELTAVRPITKKVLDDYELPDGIRERLGEKHRGVFIAGPPGSGKSTFAAAVAEHLHDQKRVVKTMEQPRDLQVPKEVTQYGALDRDMKWTGDVILLVRPDHVLYDEVRTTEDFVVFADMRLAGVGLIGVTHANRAIDAVQRLIGRIELGMIPQVVDTILFVDAGTITEVLELEFTVKVPEGMTQEDLARPVVLVKGVPSGQALFELYTYGEQVVVMPLGGTGARPARDGASQLAGREVERVLRRHVQGPLDIQVGMGKATIYVAESEVPALIGKGGRTVQGLERKLGIRLDIKPIASRAMRASNADDGWKREMAAARGAYKQARDAGSIRIKASGSNLFLLVDDAQPGEIYVVKAEDGIIGEATASNDRKLRFKRESAEGRALLEAQKRGVRISVESGG